jgi:hypothetical protein
MPSEDAAPPRDQHIYIGKGASREMKLRAWPIYYSSMSQIKSVVILSYERVNLSFVTTEAPHSITS